MGTMNGIDVLLDVASRPKDALAALPSLTTDQLNHHPEGHPNSVAWLLWHTGREIDMQLAALTSDDEIWRTGSYRDELGLGEIGDSLGYGHSPSDAEQIQVRGTNSMGTLTGYINATLEALIAYCRTLTDSDLGETIAEYDGEPISRGTRLISIVDDASAHLAQAAYVAGMRA